MRQPTPTFTPTSKAGADALASAEAAGVALETSGRRVNFGCGMLLGGVVGFLVIGELSISDAAVREWLASTGLPGYWAVVLIIAVATGVATARYGTRAWNWLHEVWSVS